ncbi:aspartyl-phosphate phosphatase Spo0E family protein [Paenibacillus ginsengarvi]|uniref:Aspartyl-phosphate phosphatase Spo0E family protein n=1 Tax=Paenibacillus ginsengarvi TaxID=400777 RepID=A0A3B0BDA4_9BACL|nr:aspartyl-phosphate phosphatase Spo0E family protein [Paenibacillus ginsengarvi]RKN70652.1 aspartyl-phosphate phosphatase Spo0E family protein [Paenibacillus ginsengarvi]
MGRADELLKHIEIVRRELNEQALLYGLQSNEVLEKSKELDQLMNAYQSEDMRECMDSNMRSPYFSL